MGPHDLQRPPSGLPWSSQPVRDDDTLPPSMPPLSGGLMDGTPTTPLSSPDGVPAWWGTDGDPSQAPHPRRRGVSRRAVLIGAGAGALGLGALGAAAGLLLSRQHALPDVFTTQAGQIAHLLRRAGFGPANADIGDYLDAGISGSIDRLLNYSSIPDDLDSRLSAIRFNFNSAQDVVRWWTLRMIYSKRPLEEKMTLFWHGVLTSALTKVGGKKGYPLLIQQNKLLRSLGMGKFDDLMRAISSDPAMLIWLDGHSSTGAKPNENYARELMELFTLGITDSNGNPNYTQDDVHQGALALTGWTINRQTGKGVFVPKRHYTGTVNFLGQSRPMGLDDVVKLVCAHPSTGYHIAWRMWSFFVYENPSQSDLQPLIDAYYHSDHTIAAMVAAMLKSPQFFSTKAYRARVKSPVEFVAGTLRGLGIETDGAGLAPIMSNMGQLPFDPPNVSGWDGDKVSGMWMSTQAWMTRVNFVNEVLAVASGIPLKRTRSENGVNAAGSPLQQLINDRQIGSASDVADYFIAALLDNTIASDRRTLVHDALTSGPQGGPTFALHGGGTVAAAAIRAALYLVMSMPEYHMN
ncbi:MAG TPA: DUF1800 domain-containing protein [Ktedonobacterales bacterium]|nr:DUF1800 domain-containing protein [Ktedonobacterales bacterium]